MHTLEKVTIVGLDGKDVECGHLTCDETCTLRLKDVLTASQDYMFQIKIKSKSNATLTATIGSTKKVFDITSEWDKKVESFSSVDVKNKYMDLMFTAGEYWFYNAKLEIGAVLTDWSFGEGDITERIVEAESRITQKIDEIELKITTNEENIGKIDIKADEVKTEVINARGDKSTLSVRIDAIESSVQDANGNISNVSQKADSIEMKVTNMNVGGRNYILNSRFQGLKETIYNKFERDSLIFVSTYGANNSACDIVLDCVKDIIYKDGLTLTLSFEYYIDGIENIADGAFIGVELQFVDSAGTSTSQKFPITNLQATNQWGRYVGQLTNIDPSIINIYVHFIKQQSNGSLKYRHPKLEIGDKVSDYSLAPEDLISSIEDVQNNVDKNYEQSVADLKVLQDRIDSIVVTDESGSQVIQTADGVRWNLTQMQQGINNALDNAATANENAGNAQTSADQLKDQVNDISQKTAYMEIVQQEDGNPCLELGSSDNDFKVRLTNTSLGFYQGTLRVAYISNQALYIETAIIKSSLQFGETAGFVWRLRENGNFGLQPF
mgnify:FL=1|nr:MAG TPA: Neck appendage protein [Caudoviricetes sp.]